MVSMTCSWNLHVFTHLLHVLLIRFDGFYGASVFLLSFAFVCLYMICLMMFPTTYTCEST